MKKTQRREPKKSKLAKRANRLFSFQNSETMPIQEYYSAYPTIPTIVETFTTYSVCEPPIPELRKQRQLA